MVRDMFECRVHVYKKGYRWIRTTQPPTTLLWERGSQVGEGGRARRLGQHDARNRTYAVGISLMVCRGTPLGQNTRRTTRWHTRAYSVTSPSLNRRKRRSWRSQTSLAFWTTRHAGPSC